VGAHGAVGEDKNDPWKCGNRPFGSACWERELKFWLSFA
jgi:hypothetical protein